MREGFHSRCLKGNLTAFFRDRRGNSAAEFALILTPMILICVLIIQFGLILFVANDMHNAARDGVRQLASVKDTATTASQSVNCSVATLADDDTIANYVCRSLTYWVDSGNFTVLITGSAESAASNPEDCDVFRVEVSMPMTDILLFNPFGTFTGRVMRASASMRSQYDFVDENNNVVNLPSCV